MGLLKTTAFHFPGVNAWATESHSNQVTTPAPDTDDKLGSIRYYDGPTLVQKNNSDSIMMRNYSLLFNRRQFLSTFVIGLIIAASSSALAQQFNPELFKSLHWRSIGPFRGGRTRAVAGVPSQPNVFYMAQVNGGVWKTEDYGHTWRPIFDDQPTGSVGCIAVAPSDPNVIYVGSGEGLQRPDLSVGDG